MAENKEIILKIEGLKTYFPIKTGVFKRTTGYIKAVDNVNLEIFKNETIGIVGESGCGKTTLCKTIVKINTPFEGSIKYYEGKDSIDLLTKEKEEIKEIRKKIQYIFQDPQSSLNPVFTIFGSMRDVLKKIGIKKRANQRKVLGDIFESINLRREYMDQYPNEFSGGQRQRIGIARALSVNPELIICDEAVSALDVSVQAQVLNLLMDIKKKRELTYIFVTHDLSVVEYISDRIAVMYLGKIVELANTEDLFDNMLHPYTIALRSAVPTTEVGKNKNRIILEGDVPSPANPPEGCPFHPRCWKSMDICRRVIPELKDYSIDGKSHYVACHSVEQEMNKNRLNYTEFEKYV